MNEVKASGHEHPTTLLGEGVSMRQLFKVATSSVWLLLWVVLAVQSAEAQKRYPSIEDAWDGTDYRAVVQRVAKDGLALPTLADAETKPVFDRMVDTDNIPLRMGLNKELPVTIRYQKLDSALAPVHKLVVLYANETQKGKPYATELARMMVYESKISGAMLNLTEPLISTLEKNERYEARIADLDKVKSDARQLYSDLVQRMSETKVYSKADMLKIISSAITELPAYQQIFTNQNKQELTQKLTQQISATADQEVKTALTELRDAIEHSRVRT
jgi:hypothetical protein